MRRISIAGMLGFVGLLAVGLASLRNASPLWNGLVFTLMLGALFSGLLGAILRGRRGGSWVGFALFGWGYLLLGLVPSMVDFAELWPDQVGGWTFEKTNTPPVAPANYGTASPFAPRQEDQAYDLEMSEYSNRTRQAEKIAYWLAVMAFGGCGSLLGGFLTRSREGEPRPGADPSHDSTPPLGPR